MQYYTYYPKSTFTPERTAQKLLMMRRTCTVLLIQLKTNSGRIKIIKFCGFFYGFISVESILHCNKKGQYTASAVQKAVRPPDAVY